MAALRRMQKNILVTGGAGFVGSHLVQKLLKEGNKVTIIDNLYTSSLDTIKPLLTNPNCAFINHDVTIPFEGNYDEIYNLACPASPVHYQKDPLITIHTSYAGITNVLMLAAKTNARVLHASISEIYGDPLEHPQTEKYWGNVNTLGVRSCYDEGKRIAETLCADYAKTKGVDVRIIRIFNTYGPNMDPQDGRVVSNFIMQALQNKDITLYGEGTQTRSFQYVDDLITGMLMVQAMDKQKVHNALAELNWNAVPVFNIGNPREFTIKELAEKVLKYIPSSTSKIVHAPLPQDDPKQRKPNITHAKKVLGWEPRITLDEGLQKTIAYFKTKV